MIIFNKVVIKIKYFLLDHNQIVFIIISHNCFYKLLCISSNIKNSNLLNFLLNNENFPLLPQKL